MKRNIVLISVGLGAGVLFSGVFKEPPPHTSSYAPQHAQAASVPGDPNLFVDLAKKVVPSVVNISTTTVLRGGQGPGGNPRDFFRKFFEDYFQTPIPEEEMPAPKNPGPKNPQNPRNLPKAASLGTGFVVEPGLILTNNHVVQGADEIKISFTEDPNEKPTDGEVVGRDPELDLALIKVSMPKSITPLPLGDSEKLEVGEYVMAVGNPFGQGHSVTHGIISAKGRVAPDFVLANYLQTDAPINPGNSGGPLVNLKGEVIGINNAIDQRAQGIGFAIPINLVKKVLPQLKSKGSVSRGYIGILVDELTPEIAEQINAKKDMRAPFVAHVYPGEPADKAGLKPYDIITTFAGKPIQNPADLIRAVTEVNVGESAPIKVVRNGREMEMKIQVTKRPGREELVAGPKNKEKPKKENGVVHGELGLVLEELNSTSSRQLGLPINTRGVLVTQVGPDTPAERAGIQSGDVILEVDRKAVKSTKEFQEAMGKRQNALLRVRRMDPQGQERFFVVILDLKK